MAYTQQQVEALEAAIAEGVLTVRDANGQVTTYQNLDAMTRLRSQMIAELTTTAGTSRKRTFRLYQHGSGN